MRSQATTDFWRLYDQLPVRLQERALKQYRLWLVDPSHPSVGFKKVGRYWSARVSDSYRAVGVTEYRRLVLDRRARRVRTADQLLISPALN